MIRKHEYTSTLLRGKLQASAHSTKNRNQLNHEAALIEIASKASKTMTNTQLTFGNVSARAMIPNPKSILTVYFEPASCSKPLSILVEEASSSQKTKPSICT